jgi:hypothetical protein
MDSLITLFFVAFGGVSILLWSKMIGIMKEKGCDTNYFMKHPGQYIQFYHLIKTETNPDLKKKYSMILWIQIALIPVFLVGVVILFNNIQ